MKNTQIWLGSYLKNCMRRVEKRYPKHLLFCFVDHFEPDFGNASMDIQQGRVDYWLKNYPALAARHKDADGFFPKHSFFYPIEVYNEEQVEKLARLCRQGYGEIEIHLHHGNDNEEGLRSKLREGVEKLKKLGILPVCRSTGRAQFGFIHGNWALNNSRMQDQWCGVNDECRILAEEGCFADFTLPAAPDIAQTRKINSIYYATSSKDLSKGHNDGVSVKVGEKPSGHLIIIQGPLALNFKRRKKGIFPRIENADITEANPPTADRMDLWVNQNIHVEGRPEWVFVKVHCHGAVENNARVILGNGGETMFSYLETKYNDGEKFILHYVSAREMYNIAKAAEAGHTGNPDDYRNYELEWK